MATHHITIDISTTPELAKLVAEVEATQTPRRLTRNNQVVALLTPASSRKKRAKTKADYEAFQSAAGGWKDVDTDKLLHDIYEDRRRTNARPAMKL